MVQLLLRQYGMMHVMLLYFNIILGCLYQSYAKTLSGL